MNVFAYDLDGILLADISYEKLDSFYSHNDLVIIRSKTEPIFIPKSPYYLITGRPIEELSFTQSWIDEYFKPTERPLALFHTNGDWKHASVYKADILNSHPKITVYFESCKLQVKYIKKLLTRDTVEIVLWSDFILNQLNNLKFKNFDLVKP